MRRLSATYLPFFRMAALDSPAYDARRVLECEGKKFRLVAATPRKNCHARCKKSLDIPIEAGAPSGRSFPSGRILPELNSTCLPDDKAGFLLLLISPDPLGSPIWKLSPHG